MAERERTGQPCRGRTTASQQITPTKSYLTSPVRLVLVTVTFILASELIIIPLLEPLLTLPVGFRAIAHTLFLLLLLVPAYIFGFKPYLTSYRAALAEIRKLSQQLLMVSEQERDHLAGELHDDAAQYLTALKLAVGALTNTPAATAAEDDINSNLQHLAQLVDETQERLRQVVTKLRLPDLNAGGLIQVLRELVKRCELQFPQVQISFTSHGCQDSCYPLIDIVLYRICQEGICNAVRHGEATQITINFSCEKNFLGLQISDDGHGFDPD